MALWLVRAGRHGEYEKKFLDEGRIYLTWDGLSTSLVDLPDSYALTQIYQDVYPRRVSRPDTEQCRADLGLRCTMRFSS